MPMPRSFDDVMSDLIDKGRHYVMLTARPRGAMQGEIAATWDRMTTLYAELEAMTEPAEFALMKDQINDAIANPPASPVPARRAAHKVVNGKVVRS